MVAASEGDAPNASVYAIATRQLGEVDYWVI
jgi:hypothetical protein